MNKLTKISMTALSTALIAGSVQAMDYSISGGASIGYTSVNTSSDSNPWSMGDSITFSTSGDLDNGMTVSVSLEMDDHGSDAIDDKKITIDTGNGVIGFATSIGGIGGIGTIANKVPNALTPVFEATNAVDYGQADQKMSSAGQWGYKHTVGGVGISIGYTPGGNTNGGADTGWSVSYADLMDGLEVGFGQQDDGTTSESETAYIKYVTGGITVAYQKSKVDYESTATSDEDATHYGVSMAVNDDLSVSVGRQDVEIGTSASEEENTGVSASYTMGSVKVGLAFNKAGNVGGSAGVDHEATVGSITFSF